MVEEKPTLLALIGPPDEYIGYIISKQAGQLGLIFFKTYWDTKLQIDHLNMGSGRKNAQNSQLGILGLPQRLPMQIHMYPESQHAKAIQQCLQFWGWPYFLYIYAKDSALEKLEQMFPGSMDAKFIRIDHGDYMAAAYKMRSLQIHCMNMFYCYPLNLVIIDLENKEYDAFYEAVLMLGMVQKSYWFVLTTPDLTSMNMEMIRYNNARISGVTLQTSDDIHNQPYSFMQIINASRTEWRIQNKHANYFPYTDLILALDSVIVFGNALLNINLSVVNFERHCFKIVTAETEMDIMTQGILSNIHNINQFTNNGFSGDLSFQNGLRQNVSLNLLELKHDSTMSQLGSYNDLDGLRPNLPVPPKDRNHLRVTTILARPFLSIKAPLKQDEEQHFEGFCLDLLNQLFREMHLSYSIHLVKDGKYGQKASNGSWDGMIGEIMRDEADLALAPLTITYDRANVVDFTKPYMQVAVSLLMRLPDPDKATFLTFLRPLSWQIWWRWLGSFFAVAFVLFVVTSISPYERVWINTYTAHLGDNDSKDTIKHKDQALFEKQHRISLAQALWLTACVLFRVGTLTSPRTISSRMILGIWWVCSSILLATYTANFSAMLTVERRTPQYRDFKDLLNQTRYKYGFMRGGSTMNFFQKAKYPVFTEIWNKVKNTDLLVNSNDEGVQRVMDEDYIYMMESPHVEYTATNYCNLTSSYGFTRTGYGFALKKGSPLTDRISSYILKYAEDGKIAFFRRFWWKEKPHRSCKKRANENIDRDERKSMDAHYIIGLLATLVGGCVMAFLLSTVEFYVSNAILKPNQTILQNLGELFSSLTKLLNWKRSSTLVPPKVTRLKRMISMEERVKTDAAKEKKEKEYPIPEMEIHAECSSNEKVDCSVEEDCQRNKRRVKKIIKL